MRVRNLAPERHSGAADQKQVDGAWNIVATFAEAGVRIATLAQLKESPGSELAKQCNNAHKCRQWDRVLKLAGKDNQVPRVPNVGTEEAFCALSDWL